MSERSYLIVSAADLLCGLDTQGVIEIVPLPDLLPVAGLGDRCWGAIDLRGRLIPTIDLASSLDRRRSIAALTDCVVVLGDAADRCWGVIVTAVLDLQPIRDDLPEAATASLAITGESGALIRAVVPTAGQAVALLNLDRLYDQAIARSPDPPPPIQPDWSPADRAILRSRAAELAKAPEQDALLDQGTPLVVVELHDEWFAIDTPLVREFAYLTRLVPIPCCPPHILGNANLRGEIITAVDLGPWLGFDRRLPTDSSLVAIVEVDDLTVGLVIDQALDALWIDPNQLSAVPLASHQADAHGRGRSRDGSYLQGISVHQGRAIAWLDLVALLSDGSLVVNETVS